MMGLSAYRPFAIESIVPEGWGALGGALDLICACQIKHQGFPDSRAGNAGALALAEWIMAHQDMVAKPKVGTHPLNSGAMIERLLIGEVLPSEEFGIALANMTEGTVLPEMFGLPEADDGSSAHLPPGADEEAPGPQPVPPCQDAAPVSSDDRSADLPNDGRDTALPPLGALGGQLPSGRLFHPIADSRFPQGFVLTGCGMALCLDESTAKAMQAAIAAGLDHIRATRGGRRLAA